jgi:hypothetical protein
MFELNNIFLQNNIEIGEGSLSQIFCGRLSNPESKERNPESEERNPESKEWNPESKECKDYLTWGDA